VARPNAFASVSNDLRHISVVEINYRGDAFSSRVVKVSGGH
jgi:hypothetical protein